MNNVNAGIAFGRHGNDCGWIPVDQQLHGHRAKEISNTIGQCITKISEKYHLFDEESITYEFGCEDSDSLLTFYDTYSFLQQLAYHNGTSHPMLRGSNVEDNSTMSITVIGDSIMRQQFYFLSCLLDPNVEIVNSKDTFEYWWGPKAPRWRSSQSGRIRVVYYEWGSFFTPQYGDILREDLSKALYDSKPNDVILINEGAHERIHQLGRLNQIVHFMVQIFNDIRRDIGDKTPLLIWRETTPQNFPTPNGWYIEGTCDTAELRVQDSCKCIPITEEMNSEDNIYHISANMRNIIAHDILKDTQVFYDPIFEPLAKAPFDIHSSMEKGDCSHIGVNGLAFMTQVFASTILGNIEKHKDTR